MDRIDEVYKVTALTIKFWLLYNLHLPYEYVLQGEDTSACSFNALAD